MLTVLTKYVIATFKTSWCQVLFVFEGKGGMEIAPSNSDTSVEYVTDESWLCQIYRHTLGLMENEVSQNPLGPWPLTTEAHNSIKVTGNLLFKCTTLAMYKHELLLV